MKYDPLKRITTDNSAFTGRDKIIYEFTTKKRLLKMFRAMEGLMKELSVTYETVKGWSDE